MAFNFKNLTEDVRKYMEDEVNADISKGTLYFGKNLSSQGIREYPRLLIESIRKGNEVTLAESLIGLFNSHYERRTPSGGTTWAKVPGNANTMLAEGEFNRFYIRAICRKALDLNKQIKIYRAKFSVSPRAESERKIGLYVDANQLLHDLRSNVGTDTALGLPSGPNSGLSVEIVD